MKTFLLYKGRDFDLRQKSRPNEYALTQDLELDTLFNAMSLGDKFLFEVARKVVLSGLSNDLDTILYRQNVLRDCLKNASIVRDIYNIAVESIEKERKDFWGVFGRSPSSTLYGSRKVLRMFVDMLKKLKKLAEECAEKFVSEGFTTFFAMVNKELNDEYFISVQNHLKELEFRNGVLVSAELGKGNKSTNFILRKQHGKNESWMERIFAPKTPVYDFYVSGRDESGARYLSELEDKGINLVANALAQSTDHILSLFNMLRTELAFYLGCLNLHGQLAQMGEIVSFPLPVPSGEHRHSFRELYDVCLALTMGQKIVANDVNADNKDLVIITGANQGGKSTFLRSIGLSQLMMQCGMFVPAKYFCSNVCDRLFTHFKREEDVTMNSGKLDEELDRMSSIVDTITPDSMVLFNESFAATNEREGSEIARQVVWALLEKRIKVFFVTHLYEFAHAFYDKKMETAIFLRAERQTDGGRTFKIMEGEPLQTSYGEDLYSRIFETDDQTHSY
jgi:DNA mismatch repair ATPase MutS